MSVHLKIQTDIGNTSCEMNKHQELTKPSQNDDVKLKELDEKLDALLKMMRPFSKLTIEILSHDYLVPKNFRVNPKISTNAQLGEVVSSADMDENQTLSASKRRFEYVTGSSNSSPSEQKNFILVQPRKSKKHGNSSTDNVVYMEVNSSETTNKIKRDLRVLPFKSIPPNNWKSLIIRIKCIVPTATSKLKGKFLNINVETPDNYCLVQKFLMDLKIQF